MARAQDQKRWRARSSRKRIEITLPVDTVSALDWLASERRQSRAAVIAALIDEQPKTAERTGYHFRRPQTDTERRYEWILILDGEPLAGLKRDDFQGWLGSYLKPSMLSRPCKRKTRDAVAQELIDAPDLYR